MGLTLEFRDQKQLCSDVMIQNETGCERREGRNKRWKEGKDDEEWRERALKCTSIIHEREIVKIDRIYDPGELLNKWRKEKEYVPRDMNQREIKSHSSSGTTFNVKNCLPQIPPHFVLLFSILFILFIPFDSKLNYYIE